jgi:putative membrane protein
MIFGPILMIGVLVLAVVVVAWLMRALGFGSQPTLQSRSPLDILKERFARGEIDRKEYEERKALLSA